MRHPSPGLIEYVYTNYHWQGRLYSFLASHPVMAPWTLYGSTVRRTIAAFHLAYGAFRNRRLSGRVKNVKVVRQICAQSRHASSLLPQVFDADCDNLDLILVPGGYYACINTIRRDHPLSLQALPLTDRSRGLGMERAIMIDS